MFKTTTFQERESFTGHLKVEKQGKQKRKEFVYIKIPKGMWM